MSVSSNESGPDFVPGCKLMSGSWAQGGKDSERWLKTIRRNRKTSLQPQTDSKGVTIVHSTKKLKMKRELICSDQRCCSFKAHPNMHLCRRVTLFWGISEESVIYLFILFHLIFYPWFSPHLCSLGTAVPHTAQERFSGCPPILRSHDQASFLFYTQGLGSRWRNSSWWFCPNVRLPLESPGKTGMFAQPGQELLIYMLISEWPLQYCIIVQNAAWAYTFCV